MVRGRTTAPKGLVLGHEITGEVLEAGRDVESGRVDHAVGALPIQVADLGDHPVLDADVRAVARGARTVEDEAVLDDEVEEFRKLNASIKQNDVKK